METRELEVEVPPRPEREQFGHGTHSQQTFELHSRRWRAEVNQQIAAALPEGFGLYKWHVEERQGRWIAVAQIVGG
jgi:hypothetical protein